jgi:hypothetical protein
MQTTTQTKTPLKATISEMAVVEMLREIIRGLGFDPIEAGPDNLQIVADKLSKVAGKSPAWGWRYMRNVLNRKIEASGSLMDAIMRLGAMQDGAPARLVNSKRVTVYVLNEVTPGSLVFGSSKVCANPACGVMFVSDIWNKRCCSPECSKVARKARHQPERVNGRPQ